MSKKGDVGMGTMRSIHHRKNAVLQLIMDRE
jgi:hypothetical protein